MSIFFKTKKLTFEQFKRKNNKVISVGTPFVFDKDGKYYDIETKEEREVISINFQDFLNKKKDITKK
jgi:hypothetical protein